MMSHLDLIIGVVFLVFYILGTIAFLIPRKLGLWAALGVFCLIMGILLIVQGLNSIAPGKPLLSISVGVVIIVIGMFEILVATKEKINRAISTKTAKAM